MMETIVIHLPGPKGFTRSADFSRVPTLGEMVLLDNTAYEGHMTNW